MSSGKGSRRKPHATTARRSGTFSKRFSATGATGWPEIIAEADGRIVVDPHSEPPPEVAPELCQVFTMNAGKIVRIDDYANHKSAREAVGL